MLITPFRHHLADALDPKLALGPLESNVYPAHQRRFSGADIGNLVPCDKGCVGPDQRIELFYQLFFMLLGDCGQIAESHAYYGFGQAESIKIVLAALNKSVARCFQYREIIIRPVGRARQVVTTI